jgi:hypothetical protein
VDVNDALSPESAAGVELRSLLWLRMSAERTLKLAAKPWSRLEQALRATDLLLQTGGFAAIVLDMNDVLPHRGSRTGRIRPGASDRPSKHLSLGLFLVWIRSQHFDCVEGLGSASRPESIAGGLTTIVFVLKCKVPRSSTTRMSIG